jgi:hypothetical protein
MNVRRLLAGGVLVGVLMIGTAAPALAGEIIGAGGGTWNYGTSYQFPWFKNSWSHYVHPHAYHSATAICDKHNPKVYADAGDWANAESRCGTNDKAAQYWNTY